MSDAFHDNEPEEDDKVAYDTLWVSWRDVQFAEVIGGPRDGRTGITIFYHKSKPRTLSTRDARLLALKILEVLEQNGVTEENEHE